MFFSRKKERKSLGVSERSEGERSEPERNVETPKPAPPPMGACSVLGRVPDPEVPEKATRRKYTADYKRKILEETDRCKEPGQIGAILRREGLYSSHLVIWRRQRSEAILQGLNPRKRGAKEQLKNPLEKEVQQLQRENEKLKCRLKQAETIIEAQKKISEILGIPLKNEKDGESD